MELHHKTPVDVSEPHRLQGLRSNKSIILGLTVKYFLPDKSEDDLPSPHKLPKDLELVNFDVLTGNPSDKYVQLYLRAGALLPKTCWHATG